MPVLILCAESIRRWTREVSAGRFTRVFRVIGCFICFMGGLVCFAASVIAATTPVNAITPSISKSDGYITYGALAAAAFVGTIAVMAKVKQE